MPRSRCGSRRQVACGQFPVDAARLRPWFLIERCTLDCMKRLNYHHLLYFWTTAKLGSVSAASKELKLSQPTVSEQIHALEQELGKSLFRRKGKNLEMTEFGRLAFRYAEKIFRLGRELAQAVNEAPKNRNRRPEERRRSGSATQRRSRQ